MVAFTGIVEAMNAAQSRVNGQTVTLDPQTSLDPNIAGGDEVKAETINEDYLRSKPSASFFNSYL